MTVFKTIEDLRCACESADLPFERLEPIVLPALTLVPSVTDDEVGASRIGGLPDLPQDVAWPVWDPTDAIREFRDYWTRHWGLIGRLFAKLRRALVGPPKPLEPQPPLPLAFLAQINLAEVSAPAGLPLPASGLLYFFYELSVQPWGFSSTHRGAFRVLYAPADSILATRDAPEELDPKSVFPSRRVRFEPVLTLPDWPAFIGDDRRMAKKFNHLCTALGSDDANTHQVGGHPDQIQGDMTELCSLASKGVSVGEPPNLSPAEQERLTADASEWRLLLQLVSDDDLGWMWGDVGNLCWWIKEGDLRNREFDKAWFQLQCG